MKRIRGDSGCSRLADRIQALHAQKQLQEFLKTLKFQCENNLNPRYEILSLLEEYVEAVGNKGLLVQLKLS